MGEGEGMHIWFEDGRGEMYLGGRRFFEERRITK